MVDHMGDPAIVVELRALELSNTAIPARHYADEYNPSHVAKPSAFSGENRKQR